MPVYQYTATDNSGKKLKGRLETAGETELQLRLKAEGKYLLKYEEVKAPGGKPMKSVMLADFCRQLGSLLRAGVTIVRALSIIADEEGLKPKYQQIYANLVQSLRQGTALSDSLAAQGNTFPPLMIHMFRSAEASGNLEVTALKMAEHYDKDNRLTQKVKSAFTYPKILSFMIVLVLTVIMGYVMPQFDELFSAMPQLPFATQVLFWLSDLVTQKWWLLILIIFVSVVGFRILFRLPQVKLVKDQLVLKIPSVGRLMKTIYTARFARAFSSLYACGISAISALQISRNVIGNSYIEKQFDDLIPFVRSGNALSDGIKRVDGFVKKLSASVRVGEESGNLEEMLNSMADNFDNDSELALNKLVSYLEPAMIIIMAVIIAFIMFAVVTPIYDSYSYIGA